MAVGIVSYNLQEFCKEETNEERRNAGTELGANAGRWRYIPPVIDWNRLACRTWEAGGGADAEPRTGNAKQQ
jgi:hypothetical protein